MNQPTPQFLSNRLNLNIIHQFNPENLVKFNQESSSSYVLTDQ